MKNTTGHDLLVPNYVYENYSQLHLPSIPLTVPTIDGVMMLNGSVPNNGLTQITVNVEKPGESIVISRPDGPMQAMEADSRHQNFGRNLFETAIDSLAITICESCILEVDMNEQNIQHQHMFDSFVGLVSYFAVLKQNKLIRQLAQDS